MAQRGLPLPENSPYDLRLRAVDRADFPILFEQQLDVEANRMAAFTAKDPRDRITFTGHWTRLLADPTILKRTILVDDAVAGSLLGFEQFGKPSVSYWLRREFWVAA